MEMIKVGLHPSVLNGNNQALSTMIAKHPMRQTKIKTFTISRGDMHAVKKYLHWTNTHRIVIGVLESEAYYGNLRICPFIFTNFNLNYLVPLSAVSDS